MTTPGEHGEHSERSGPTGHSGRTEREQRVLTQGDAAVVASIADALVIKMRDVYFLSRADGQVPLGEAHGFGLYHGDCRFLKGYELKVQGERPSALMASTRRGFKMDLMLSNPDITLAGGREVKKETLTFQWERNIDAERAALDEALVVTNHGSEPIDLEVQIRLEASFDDVFVIRGLIDDVVGRQASSFWEKNRLTYLYDGADGRWRSLVAVFDREPSDRESDGATFTLHVEASQSATLLVTLDMAIGDSREEVVGTCCEASDGRRSVELLEQMVEDGIDDEATIETDFPGLNEVVQTSFRDLQVLRMPGEPGEFIAAGVPWFVTLFGRDSLFVALQMLAVDARLAESTLRLLAGRQGKAFVPRVDEEPGKILHEWRDGELARIGAIPHAPAYYGTVDATLLFLILLGEQARWTGSTAVFESLRPEVEAAITWMTDHADHDGDGYLDYEGRSAKALVNQGWKDSGNAIVNDDGSLARPPIALVEVQAYAYAARLACAQLLERLGERDRAGGLRADAAALKHRFNRDYWADDLGCYYLALQRRGEPCAVVTSNAGHALWTGIATPELAARTAERLMQADMFSGWGVRTLSTQAAAYNPVGYHLGTVWPHDSVLIAAGFRRYGFDAAARRIADGLIAAATSFDSGRLPELFSGIERGEFTKPVPYPVACHPQAWASAAMPHLIVTLLGLQPDAFSRRLWVERPLLPTGVERLTLRDLCVGEAAVTLSFERRRDGEVTCSVEKTSGELEVVRRS